MDRYLSIVTTSVSHIYHILKIHNNREYVPLKIHSRRKSGSETCSLRTACVRVMKFLAWPEVPVICQSKNSRSHKVQFLSHIPFFLILAMVGTVWSLMVRKKTSTISKNFSITFFFLRSLRWSVLIIGLGAKIQQYHVTQMIGFGDGLNSRRRSKRSAVVILDRGCEDEHAVKECLGRILVLIMSVDRRKAVVFGAAFLLRLLLCVVFPSLPDLLTGRVEVSTPVNSFKRREC